MKRAYPNLYPLQHLLTEWLKDLIGNERKHLLITTSKMMDPENIQQSISEVTAETTVNSIEGRWCVRICLHPHYLEHETPQALLK